MNLLEPLSLGSARAPSRVMFGPHETNLGQGRAISARHVAYYERRAAGGCGVIVTEIASVHPSDWPYERAPLAADCGPGWSQTAAACAPHGTPVLAGLGHAGMQGSSAFSQSALWAPSRVPDATSRELPMEMAESEINAVIDGFAAAAALARRSGLAGVEINAGQYSLLRQFQSGLTNQRTDAYGQDRLLLTERVLRSVRTALGRDQVLGLRLCCDELAPWAGLTPELAAESAARLAGLVDYLVVVRGSIYSVPATRPDLHSEP
ncbi:MAG: NADH:flavin oxidoreductase, partial [Streptosporangiaceae bacterium]